MRIKQKSFITHKKAMLTPKSSAQRVFFFNPSSVILNLYVCNLSEFVAQLLSRVSTSDRM